MKPEQQNNFYDAIIIGGGPAGLTAALYLARARYKVLVLEKEQFGGQITITHEVVNFPGVEISSGKELTETMRKQAESFGAQFLKAEVTSVNLLHEIKTVNTTRGVFECFGVLIATGAHPRMIGFPGEAEYKGRGIAYCATCDGEFFTGKEVFVVGGGFAAAEEAVFLTRYASHVTILVREPDFTCADAAAQPAREHPNITVHYNSQVDEVSGDDFLRRISWTDSTTGKQSVYESGDDTFGVFVFAGYAPASQLVKDQVELNSMGYVVTDKNQKTSLDGVYAAGDICEKNLRQVVTATGDGALAATELERHAAAMQAKTGIIPQKPEGIPAPQKAAIQPEPALDQAEGSVLSADILSQLANVFARMENPLILSVDLDDRPVSATLRQYVNELCSLSDTLSVEIREHPDARAEDHLPVVRVLTKDHQETGLAFHGAPGGHEFTSFVLGLYNAAGPGQPLDPALKKQAEALEHPVDMRIFVSLSCTMCPELVMSAQRLAALNPNLSAEVYDLSHYPDLKERYKVMSVPCLVMTQNQEEKVFFGKKNAGQLLELMA